MNSSRMGKMLTAIGCFLFFMVTAYFVVKSIAFPAADARLPAIVYFTIQSNIMVSGLALYVGLRMLNPTMRDISPLLILIITVNITVTGLIYWMVLVPMFAFKRTLFTASNIWLHSVTPIVTILYFLRMRMKMPIDAGKTWRVLIYPAVYLVFSYVVHAFLGKYTYPFIDPEAMGGVVFVALAIVGIGVLFYVLGVMYRRVWNKKTGKGVQSKRSKVMQA